MSDTKHVVLIHGTWGRGDGWGPTRAICEQGHWWGLVTYDIAYGARRKPVTHWIPAWVLKRKP